MKSIGRVEVPQEAFISVRTTGGIGPRGVTPGRKDAAATQVGAGQTGSMSAAGSRGKRVCVQDAPSGELSMTAPSLLVNPPAR